MAEVKPYICRTQCLPSISDLHLPFPISKLNTTSRLHNFTSLRLSQSHRIPTHQPILCAGRRGWSQSSNRKILQLASIVAFNLKILPEPFNSLIGEIARGNSRNHRILNRLVGGLKGKSTKRKSGKKFVWLFLVLVCIAGLWLWKVSELNLFLRSLFFCLVGVFSTQLWLGNKAIKEWFLGFLCGIVLMMMSFRLSKEDVKFWVQKLKTCLPVAQITMRSRNGKRIFK